MRCLKKTFAALLFAAILGCTPGDKTASKGEGGVSATAEFVKHFGAAPAVDKGKAYAFVIFYPSAREPGKVMPFPFFSFDEPSLKKVALAKLVGGMGDFRSYRGEIAHPFPAGTRVLDLVQNGGTVTVTFSKEISAIAPGSAAERAAMNAVSLTLRQFEGVKGVSALVEGGKAALSGAANKADSGAVLPLGPPRLLSVTAMKEKGEDRVEEVDAFFDRPVQIEELVMSGADGKPFEGETYQSVFDMAAVLKPKDAARFTAGMPVMVRWKVVDKLGRGASGQSDLLLEVKEH